MHPFDAASFLSATPAEGSFEPPQQQEEELGAAASSPSPSPSRGMRAGGENAAGVRCQDCRHRRANAYCAHCCSRRGCGSVCPGHVNNSHVPASQQCRERHQTTLAASASTAAVDNVEPIPNKRPRRPALPSVAAAPTTKSSVDQPIATTALERFAREVSLDAVFRRVWLGGGPAEPEVAYYTAVTIAGHVFRGVLYDVGAHSGSTAASDTDGSGEAEVGSSLSTAAGGSSLDLTLGL